MNTRRRQDMNINPPGIKTTTKVIKFINFLKNHTKTIVDTIILAEDLENNHTWHTFGYY